MERDVLKLVPEFLNTWLLNDYKTVADCSGHIVTKEPISVALHKGIRDGKLIISVNVY